MSARLALIVPLPIDVEPDPPGFGRRAVAEQLRAAAPGLTRDQVAALVEREAAAARADQPAAAGDVWTPNFVDLDPAECRRAVALDSWHRRVTVDADTGCHLWTGGTSPAGYGQVIVAGRKTAAHRVAYTAANGPIPPGLVLDHLCRNRACVNAADHLEAVEPGENSRRAVVEQMARTHCPAGHELVAGNLRPGPAARGWRCCATCQRDRDAALAAAARRLGLTRDGYLALFGSSRTVAEQIAAGADPIPLLSRGADPAAAAAFAARHTTTPLDLDLEGTP